MKSPNANAPRIQSLFTSGHSRHVGERFGLEIELENQRRSRGWDAAVETEVGEHWTTTDDGSLRGGVEYVSRPLPPALVGRAVAAVYRAAEWYGRGPSVRCGLHIHANMAGHTAARLSEVLAAYILAEPYLFAFVGREREQSIYCIPWYLDRNQYDVAASISRVANAGEPVAMEDTPLIEGACKYSALNMLPLFRFHTIEFRQAPAYATPGEVMSWFNIVHAVTTKAPWVASRSSPAEAIETLFSEHLSKEQMDTAREIAEEYDTRGAHARFLARCVSCTYKADWGLPAALEAESAGKYRPEQRSRWGLRRAPNRRRDRIMAEAPPIPTPRRETAAAQLRRTEERRATMDRLERTLAEARIQPATWGEITINTTERN